MASSSSITQEQRRCSSSNPALNRNGTKDAEKVLKRNVAWYSDAKDRIIAVDFGTSTLAVAWLAQQDGVVKELMISENSRYIPTVLLVKRDAEGKGIVKIGEKALIDYQKAISDPSGSDESQVVFFEKIKMELQHDQSVHRLTTITGSNGKQYYLMEVISLVLKKVKERVKVLLATRSMFDIDTFSWVLTVPALWGESARRMMKDSAYLAGYCGNVDNDLIPLPLLTSAEHQLPTIDWVNTNPDRVSLVFEPEAAAAWCTELDRANVRDKTDMTASLRTSQCFLTADIGGGTIDITAHQMMEDGRMLFFRLPSGKVHGGAGVNEDFISFLEEVTESKINNYYCFGNAENQTQKRAEIQYLKNKSFEEAKKQFAEADDNDDYCSVSIPKSYCQMYQTILNEKSSKPGNLFYFVENTNQLRLKEPLMRKLMAKYLDQITSCIQSSMDHIAKHGQRPQIIYLVGGFGGSNCVVDHVKRIFKGIRFVIPHFHELAVVKGACLYYRNKAVRIADATYGTECKIPYNPDNEVHKRGEIVEGNNGERFCKALFKPFVHVGDQLDPEFVYRTVYSPIREEQRSLLLTLYSTRKVNVDFIEHGGNLNSDLHKMAVIFVNLEELKLVPFENRLIHVLIDFSSVEITICAYYVSNGQEVRLKSSTEFLSTLEKLKSIENNDNIYEMH